MTLDQLRTYCVSKEFVTEEMPFGVDTLVFKVAGKIFALSGIEPFETINLKNTPDKITALKDEYEAVKEGYHMSKKHWITVHVSELQNDKLLTSWIDESYQLVWDGLSKKTKDSLTNF